MHYYNSQPPTQALLVIVNGRLINQKIVIVMIILLWTFSQDFSLGIDSRKEDQIFPVEIIH